MKIRQAFILGGGRGERLRPLTDSTPKPLVKVAGKPIIEYSLELLQKHGVEQVILSIGYLHEKIEKHLGSGEKWGLKINYAIENEPLGTGGALAAAKDSLDESFFMLNGDNIADFDLGKMQKAHTHSKLLGTIALTEVEDASSYGAARIENGKIVEFVEKPAPGTEPSKFVNAGAYVLSKNSLSMLPTGFNLIERTLFPALAKKSQLGAYFHNGLWLTTDTLQRIERAEEVLDKKLHP